MARSLWGDSASEEDEARYFEYAYGPQAMIARKFLKELAEQTGSPIHGQSWWEAADEARVSNLLAFLSEHEVLVKEAGLNAQGRTQQRSWQLLGHYHRLLTYLWRAAEQRVKGNEAQGRAVLDEMVQFLQETEPETASALDTFLMLQYAEQLRESLLE